MKKIFALTLGITVLMSLFSCSKKDFDDRYYDPSKTTTVSCEKLMTGVFYTACNQYRAYGYNTYWRLYTYEGLMAQLTQQKGFTNNSGGVYYLADSYATDRWNNFYQTLSQFRLLEATYEKSEDQATDIVFKDCAEVFVLDHLSQIVDIFGPVPFSKAGYLGISGDLAASYPEYDSDETLYSMIWYMLRPAVLDDWEDVFFHTSRDLHIDYDRDAANLTMTFRGEPVDLDRMYTIGMQEFYFTSSDIGFGISSEDLIREGRLRVLSPDAFGLLQDYFRENRNLGGPVDDRYKVHGTVRGKKYE